MALSFRQQNQVAQQNMMRPQGGIPTSTTVFGQPSSQPETPPAAPTPARWVGELSNYGAAKPWEKSGATAGATPSGGTFQPQQAPLMQGSMFGQQPMQTGGTMGAKPMASAGGIKGMQQQQQWQQQQMANAQVPPQGPQSFLGNQSKPTWGPESLDPTVKQQLAFQQQQYAYQPQQGQSAPFDLNQMAAQYGAGQPQQMANRGPLPSMGQQQPQATPQQRPMMGQPRTMGQQPMAGYQGSGQQPNGMNIQTSIQPQGVFDNRFMQQAGNMAMAQAVPAMSDLRNMAGRPGLSMASPAIQAGMGNAARQMIGQGAANYAQGQQQMGWQNAQNMLAGQQARNQEALGWGNLQAQGIQNQLANQNAQQGNLYQFLRQAYGGM